MIKINLTLPLKYNKSDLYARIKSILPISDVDILEAVILRRTLCFENMAEPYYKATVGIRSAPEREAGLLKMKKKVSSCPDLVFSVPTVRFDTRPVVVGAGPAGLFAALVLAETGSRPIILERGERVEDRGIKVQGFFAGGELRPESNIQFGEGGAGAFSDGKLKSGAPDKYNRKVLSEFTFAGASEEILYSTSAHLGTDKLPIYVKAIREKIISLGGEFLFSTCLTDLVVKDGRLVRIKYKSNTGEGELDCDTLILAIGHSARDTIRMLYTRGVKMTARGFGIGVRIEHPREYINRIVYKEHKDTIADSASYHLVTHLPSGRSVYSFCMCPGGTVVAASGEFGSVVTNGMSEYSRMADNSNSALLVSVTPNDFASDNALAGIDLQSKIERAVYSMTNSYLAPCERLESLMGKGNNTLGSVKPSYPIGTFADKVENYMPDFVAPSLREAMYDFDTWLPGFKYPDATLTGPETRTTSPVRMERTESGEALTLSGLYPVGEGAGYAGGIVSSAVDGIKIAEKIIMKRKGAESLRIQII